MEYTADTVVRRLRALGVVGRDVPEAGVSVRELSGGVSAHVLLVSWHTRRVVVKQALPELSVDAFWAADPTRSDREVACVNLLGAGPVAPWWLPRVLAHDEANHGLVIEAAPEYARNWEEYLLAGKVDLAVVELAARALADLHMSEMRPSDRYWAEDISVFEQLRIKPFYEVVRARHPAISDSITGAIGALRSDRYGLVHGDYTPKNLLVWPGSLMVIDYEAAHWGDCAFDVGSIICHMVLAGFAIKGSLESACEASRVFWRKYVNIIGEVAAGRESRVSVHLACMLLARIDGKSPALYIDPAVYGIIRCAALGILRKGSMLLRDALDLVVSSKEKTRI